MKKIWYQPCGSPESIENLENSVLYAKQNNNLMLWGLSSHHNKKF